MPPRHPFLLYPTPEEVTSLPPERVRPFIMESLAEAEATLAIDMPRIVGLGQLAQELAIDDLEELLLAWLVAQPTALRHDLAALLMLGFWPSRQPAPQLVAEFCRGLDEHFASAEPRDALVGALHVAYLHAADPILKRRIWHTFKALVPRREGFPRAALKALHDVLKDGL
jgi:hypothetical protein